MQLSQAVSEKRYRCCRFCVLENKIIQKIISESCTVKKSMRLNHDTRQNFLKPKATIFATTSIVKMYTNIVVIVSNASTAGFVSAISSRIANITITTPLHTMKMSNTRSKYRRPVKAFAALRTFNFIDFTNEDFDGGQACYHAKQKRLPQ